MTKAMEALSTALGDLAVKKAALDDIQAKVAAVQAEYGTALELARKLKEELESQLADLVPPANAGRR